MEYKYINFKTGEVVKSIKDLIKSTIFDFKHFKFKVLWWAFCWKRYKN